MNIERRIPIGYHAKEVENSQRDERLLAELTVLEDAREKSWGWDEEDQADFQELTRSPRVIKTLGRIARRNMVGLIVRVFRPVLRVFSASSAAAASRHRESDDAGGDDDPDPDPDQPPRSAGAPLRFTKSPFIKLKFTDSRGATPARRAFAVAVLAARWLR